MKVVVNKCPWTGKLFESSSKYAAHLKKVRLDLRFEREKARLAAEFDEFLKGLYILDTTDAIAEWLTENYMKISMHFGPRWEAKKPYYPTADDYVEFEISTLKFNQKCPTTHSAPIGQKHTGWGKDSPHVPEAGWEGTIRLRPKGNVYRKHLVDSDHLRRIGINTGSGGGSEELLSYSLILYTKDFPGLRRRAAAHVILRDHSRPGLDSNGNILQKGDSKNLFA
jgi:uncharacterized C2H2 Zn-finger protein